MKKLSAYINFIEESLIALLLGGMVMITFVQVVLRYVFNSGMFWALELTSTLFAWLVLLGASYAVKIGTHIGVDALVSLFSPQLRKLFAFFTIIAAFTYAAVLFSGGIVYVEKLAMIGIEMEDIPVKRYIAYMVLPIGLGLIMLRLLEAAYQIWRGERNSLLVVDEAKEALDHFKITDKNKAA